MASSVIQCFCDVYPEGEEGNKMKLHLVGAHLLDTMGDYGALYHVDCACSLVFGFHGLALKHNVFLLLFARPLADFETRNAVIRRVIEKGNHKNVGQSIATYFADSQNLQALLICRRFCSARVCAASTVRRCVRTSVA